MTASVQIGRSSTAVATAFCSARVDGPDGRHLFIDGNDKVCRTNGTYGAPLPNAFSLLAGNGVVGDEPGHEREHCPGSTPTCRKGCYVHGLALHASATYDLYRHNSAAIREVLDGEDPWAWAASLASWIVDNARGGFRWHVSGDLFSLGYGDWVAEVCRLSVPVPAWIYTRSFSLGYADPLIEVATENGGNLALNLSCDRDNYAEAVAWRAAAGAGRLCYLTSDGEVPDDIPAGSVIFPDYNLRAPKGDGPNEQRATNPWWQGLTGDQRRMVCPVDFYSKSDDNRCGEGRCMKCLT